MKHRLIWTRRGFIDAFFGDAVLTILATIGPEKLQNIKLMKVELQIRINFRISAEHNEDQNTGETR